jgi:23S rRNA A2030 N6-methylase RlmJ
MVPWPRPPLPTRVESQARGCRFVTEATSDTEAGVAALASGSSHPYGRPMANQHFGKMSEVVKHGILAEVLNADEPHRFAETHAGSASYLLSHSPERDYGVYRFIDRSSDWDDLRSSAYRRVLDSIPSVGPQPGWCPGSPMVAMRTLGENADYFFFDTDPQSVATIDDAARDLDLSAHVHTDVRDGSSGVMKAFGKEPEGCVHVDPFEPFSPGTEDGPTPVEVARTLGNAGTIVVYWYGYEEPARRSWAWNEVAAQASAAAWWIGDLAYAEPEIESGIVGCGVLVGNASIAAMAKCEAFGRALETAYRGATLPSGVRGSVSFESRRR